MKNSLDIELEIVKQNNEKLKTMDWLVEIPKPNKEEWEVDSNGIIDYHQTILNIGYKWWQEQLDCNYYEMIKAVSLKYGFLFGGLILIGKYNQQVCNGGHTQYYYNGYADGSGNCMSNQDFDHPLHKDLIFWLKELIARKEEYQINGEDLEILCEVKDIIIDFINLPIDTEEEIEEEIWDDEEDDYILDIYPNNDYGQMDYMDADKLDKRFYKVNQKLMDFLEKFCNNLFQVQN